jgi:hypothetical protein
VSGNETFGTAPGRPSVSPEGIVIQGVTEVDVETLAAAVSWLDGLRSYVQTHLIPDAGKLTITKDDADLWFGGLDSAPQVSGLHSTYVKTAIESYRSVAQTLDAASRATASIVKNYKDVEHNNTVTARNIDAAFAVDPTTGAPPTSSQSTGTTAGTPVQSNQGGF